MFDAIETKLQWLENELSKLMEPHGISLAQVQTLLVDIRDEVQAGGPEGFHQRCKEMLGVGDLVMAVNAIDLCRGCIIHEPEDYAIIIDQLCVAVRMAERFQNASQTAAVLPEVFHELQGESRRKQAQRAAAARHAEDPKQQEKAFVFDLWKGWRSSPGRYRSKAQFAKDMIDKCEHLKSTKKIEDWCREWEKSEPC